MNSIIVNFANIEQIFYSFDLDPTKRDTFWMVGFGYMFHWLAGTVASQGCVQKFLAIATLEDSKK